MTWVRIQSSFFEDEWESSQSQTSSRAQPCLEQQVIFKFGHTATTVRQLVKHQLLFCLHELLKNWCGKHKRSILAEESTYQYLGLNQWHPVQEPATVSTTLQQTFLTPLNKFYQYMSGRRNALEPPPPHSSWDSLPAAPSSCHPVSSWPWPTLLSRTAPSRGSQTEWAGGPGAQWLCAILLQQTVQGIWNNSLSYFILK